jgi:hypothetical protein
VVAGLFTPYDVRPTPTLAAPPLPAADDPEGNAVQKQPRPGFGGSSGGPEGGERVGGMGCQPLFRQMASHRDHWPGWGSGAGPIAAGLRPPELTDLRPKRR